MGPSRLCYTAVPVSQLNTSWATTLMEDPRFRCVHHLLFHRTQAHLQHADWPCATPRLYLAVIALQLQKIPCTKRAPWDNHRGYRDGVAMQGGMCLAQSFAVQQGGRAGYVEYSSLAAVAHVTSVACSHDPRHPPGQRMGDIEGPTWSFPHIHPVMYPARYR